MTVNFGPFLVEGRLILIPLIGLYRWSAIWVWIPWVLEAGIDWGTGHLFLSTNTEVTRRWFFTRARRDWYRSLQTGAK